MRKKNIPRARDASRLEPPTTASSPLWNLLMPEKYWLDIKISDKKKAYLWTQTTHLVSFGPVVGGDEARMMTVTVVTKCSKSDATVPLRGGIYSHYLLHVT